MVPAPCPPGALSIVRALDREEVAQHNLTVVATDHGLPRRSATQLLSVLVLDVNDEAPAFERLEYEAQVMENLPAGSPVLRVLATDRDLGEDTGERLLPVCWGPVWRCSTCGWACCAPAPCPIPLLAVK